MDNIRQKCAKVDRIGTQMDRMMTKMDRSYIDKVNKKWTEYEYFKTKYTLLQRLK